MTEQMKELFDMARAEGPSQAQRDAMWSGIQAMALPGGSGAAAAAAKGAGILLSKLALGVALGASITVGIATTVIAITRAQPASDHTTQHTTSATPRTLDRDSVDRAELTESRRVEAVRPPVVITGHVGDTVELKDAPQQRTVDHADHVVGAPLSEHDRLAREARMVSEARGALHRGDADAALHIVRAARAQPGARLVPEELTVEAQALRALGDNAAAERVESELAGKFPEEAAR